MRQPPFEEAVEKVRRVGTRSARGQVVLSIASITGTAVRSVAAGLSSPI